MKRRFGWLLGLGLPTILGMSGSLPGPPGDSDTEPHYYWSDIERFGAKLIQAYEALSDGRLYEAKIALTEADWISGELRPHTPDFERLNNAKTELWQQYWRQVARGRPEKMQTARYEREKQGCLISALKYIWRILIG